MLDQIDPIEIYKGTEMENMDAFSRQLRRFDIKASGKSSPAVEVFFSFCNHCMEDYMSTNYLPNIIATRKWSPESVMETCQRNNLYTCGDNWEYRRMLSGVFYSNPTYVNLYKTACDIQKHSENQSIENVMFILEREAVITTFEIEERVSHYE